ncbi:MAG: PKD domain-containing protein [Cyclobacteriaceae bacterium]
MKNFFFFTTVSLLLLCVSLTSQAQCPNLVWSDEFDGNSLDLTNWSYQLGDGCAEGICGWGNNELQEYQESNVIVSNGTLQITAKREQIRGKRYKYTSGRIRSINKGDWTYGRFEASIKLPVGGGLWPAFWMLSTNEPYGGWPQSGEIDIMEFVGNKPDETLGYIHYGDPYPNNQNQGTSFPFYDPNFLDTFHEYAIEWEENEIRWYVDGYLFQTKRPEDLGGFNWPFNQDMHFLLNVAIGGNLGGEVDDNLFPSTMEVDYVRVYGGGRPNIIGERFVEYQGTNTYSIENVSQGTSVNWTAPAGASIVSGQGTPNISLNWGTVAGQITAEISTSCGTKTLALNTNMAQPYIKDFAFENFDETANAIYISSDGALTEVSNPSPNAVNGSALSGSYVRNSTAQYDNIVYATSAVTNAAEYVFGDRRFYMDVLTAAPVGTEIIIQLENSTATSTNYPDGRHSRYFGVVKESNQWHRIYFDFKDRPDAGQAPDNSISNLLILFNSNTLSGDTYYFDNLDSYVVDDGSGPGNTPPTASFTTNTTDLSADFDGSGSSDSDGSIVTWSWDFGDGNNGSGSTVSHTYAAAGEYSVVLSVTDNEGATGTKTQTVTVTETTGNTPPTASFTFTTADLSTNFDGSASSDSDGSITSWSWDFGDGNNGIGITVSHTYATAGDFTVTLTVTDNEAATDQNSQVVSVTSAPSGDPVSVHVQSIVNGTISAGRGAKFGSSTVTVHNDQEAPVEGVTVIGTFTGTFNETVAGVTTADGTVTLQTTSTAKGGVTINFCVDDLSHGSLAYDSSLNDQSCSSGSARIDDLIDEFRTEEITAFSINTYPNPVADRLIMDISSPEENGLISFKVMNINGQEMDSYQQELSKGDHRLTYDFSRFAKGLYLIIGRMGKEKVELKIYRE